MLNGSRDAPTTATDRGRKKGRSDAAAAARSRMSGMVTPFSPGMSAVMVSSGDAGRAW